MKKIEQSAKEYADGKSSSEVFRSAHEADFIAGVEFAQRWISVEDELPQEQGYYLVLKIPLFRSNCNVVVAEFRKNNTFYYQRTNSTIENVTHWRPIELK